MSSEFVKTCIKVLEHEDIKKEFNEILKPLIKVLMVDIYPYIYISMAFILICFLLILGNFILLLRANFLIKKI